MKLRTGSFCYALAAFLLAGAGLLAQAQASAPQAPARPDDPQQLVKRARKLNSEGKQDEALTLYRQALKLSPDLYEAHLGAGMALDPKGDYAEARQHLAKAIGADYAFICEFCEQNRAWAKTVAVCADGAPAPRDAAGTFAATRAADPIAGGPAAEAAEAVAVAMAVLVAGSAPRSSHRWPEPFGRQPPDERSRWLDPGAAQAQERSAPEAGEDRVGDANAVNGEPLESGEERGPVVGTGTERATQRRNEDRLLRPEETLERRRDIVGEPRGTAC